MDYDGTKSPGGENHAAAGVIFTWVIKCPH